MSAVIVGAGTYGAVYLAYLSAAGENIVGFLDDDISKRDQIIHGLRVIGTSENIESLATQGIGSLYAPIGNNEVRVNFLSHARACGMLTPSYTHPSVVLGPAVNVGCAVYILPGSIIMPHAQIDDDVMISMSVAIAHHTHLRKGVFLSTGVRLGASLSVGECAYIGMSATIVTGKATEIGAHAIVGAGAVVLRNVPPGVTVIGNPARPLVKGS